MRGRARSGTAHPLARRGDAPLLRAGRRPVGEHPVPPGQRLGQLARQPAHRGAAVRQSSAAPSPRPTAPCWPSRSRSTRSSSTVQLRAGVPRGPSLRRASPGTTRPSTGPRASSIEYNQYLSHAQSPAEPQPAALRQAPVGAGQRHAHRRPGVAGGRHERAWTPSRAPTRTARSSSSTRRTGAVLAMVVQPDLRPQPAVRSQRRRRAGVRRRGIGQGRTRSSAA